MSEQQRWAVMCSMTGYWGVARPEHSYREDDGLLACTEWESLHDTWAEAMQEADRMARTVTVTLPRPQGKKRIECTTHPSPYQVYAQGVNGHAGVGTVASPYGSIYFCDAGDMEAVALALLAHARKETN